MRKLPVLLIIFFSLFFLPTEAYPVLKEVSVLLEQGASGGSLSGTGMKLTDPYGKEIVLSGTFTIQKRDSGELSVGSHIFKIPLKAVSDVPMKYNGRAYYGSFLFRNSPNGLKVSNIVHLEQYLRGVIKAEMNPKWNIEAVKAQSILARTFAVRAGGKHGEDDLCDGYHCQVYKGISGEDRIADRAIEETSGLILRWKGSPAGVYYHSDSGGMVTSSGNVWGGDIPYLRPKAEPFAYLSPNSLWEINVSMSFIQSRLSGNGMNIGTINSITPIKRDESGRVLKMEIKGTGGSKIISGYTFRTLVGSNKLKSTLFEFGTRSPYINDERGSLPLSPVLNRNENRPSATVTVTKNIDLSEMPEDKEEKMIWLTKKRIFTTLELMEILSKPDDYDLYIEKGIARAEGRLPMPEMPFKSEENSVTETTTAMPDIRYSPHLSMASASGPNIRIFGRGSGHGVGMSQWGAKTMAENGWTFTKILDYYFPGTTIGQ
ncbi:MAG: SpoIID/LytB domain-containing protein [Synergistaceae bacterium]|nr:SpoIID/LytB domain-containing protein [Synergistaceae bacterium]